MSQPGQLIAPFDRVFGRFTFTSAPEFRERQDAVFATFEDNLVQAVRDGKIDRPRLEIKARAEDKSSEGTLVIDVRTEELLFNIDTKDVAFLLAKSNDLDLLTIYTSSLIEAVRDTLGARTLVSFEAITRQIVKLQKVKNFEVIERLVPGLCQGKGLFEHIPRNPDGSTYQVQRVDLKWTELAGDTEYIYDLEAPANEEWTQLWFDFTARTPQDKVASEGLLMDIGATLNKCLKGQTFLNALCDGLVTPHG